MMAIAPVVFLVDDDASVRTSLTRLLESAGYVVEAFASAREFLAPRTIYRSVLPGAGRRARSPGSSCLSGLSPGARVALDETTGTVAWIRCVGVAAARSTGYCDA
jgi:hypothetical protein